LMLDAIAADPALEFGLEEETALFYLFKKGA